jgi:hypothetical protein
MFAPPSHHRGPLDRSIQARHNSPATVFVPKLAIEIPSQSVLSMHFMDMLVHRLDLAHARGHSIHIRCGRRAAVALAVPDGEFRTVDSAQFGPAIPSTDQANELDRILAYLGRSPQWKPPARRNP